MRIVLFLFFLLFSLSSRAQEHFQLARPLVKYPSVFFKESTTLELKFAQPGAVITREALVDRLNRDRGAGAEATQERAIDVQITRLRRKIEADPRRPRFLQTVRGEGYMLTAG